MPIQNALLSALGKGAVPLVLWAFLLGVQGFDVPMLSQATAPASAQPIETHDAARVRPKRVAIKPKQKVTPDAASTLLPVVVQKDIKIADQILFDAVLRALPSYCRDSLKNFYVNYEPNPKSRGLGGMSTMIIVGNVPDHEKRALATHECGHVVDLGGLKGNPASGVSAFVDGSTPMYNDDPSVQFYSIAWKDATTKKAGVKEDDLVSGYAGSDAFEYFAEAFAYYALQREAFAAQAAKNPAMKAQYDFMERVVFQGSPSIATGKYVRTSRAPWDVTLLPYEWHASR